MELNYIELTTAVLSCVLAKEYYSQRLKELPKGRKKLDLKQGIMDANYIENSLGNYSSDKPFQFEDIRRLMQICTCAKYVVSIRLETNPPEADILWLSTAKKNIEALNTKVMQQLL